MTHHCAREDIHINWEIANKKLHQQDVLRNSLLAGNRAKEMSGAFSIINMKHFSGLRDIVTPWMSRDDKEKDVLWESKKLCDALRFRLTAQEVFGSHLENKKRRRKSALLVLQLPLKFVNQKINGQFK